jgi:carboxymethylenebutenolidase
MRRGISSNTIETAYAVVERHIEIATADGTADGLLFEPQSGNRRPGILYLTDIGGIRPSQRGIARRLAGQGYIVLLPNVFYRTGRPPLFDFVPQYPFKGDERTSKRFIELARPLTPDAMERDGLDYVRYLESQPSVSEGGLGMVGYSITGSMVLRTAAACPGQIRAAALFHAGGLYNDSAMSPHLLLPQIKAQLYFGHATDDHMMRSDAIKGLNAALVAWGGQFESEVYKDAYHGWTVSDGPVYHQLQAQRAFDKLSEVFSKTLR